MAVDMATDVTADDGSAVTTDGAADDTMAVHATVASVAVADMAVDITLDCVLRKGNQSNWSEKQARICVLCDAFCSHTALPRAKGVHQPRDSAVFFSKQTATALDYA